MTYIIYFIITVGVLVLVHEFGHFIAAKSFGMKVDTFSIGFPPRAFGRKIGETDYCISWIPIGGYVKIAGMVDESFDTEFLDKPPQPNEFRSKPIYQRIIVVSAGVIMNFLLTFLIFYGISLVNGRSYIASTTIGIVDTSSVAAKLGFQPGDKLIAINNKAMNSWQDIQADLYIDNVGSPLAVTLNRGGQVRTIIVPKGSAKADDQIGIYPDHMNAEIDVVDPNMPAYKAGLRPGDIILSIDGNEIAANTQVSNYIKKDKGKFAHLVIRRGNEDKQFQVMPNSDSLIGIQVGGHYTGPVTKYSYNMVSAVPVGFMQTVDATGLLVKSIWLMITGKVSFTKSIGGPIKIAQLATQSAEMGIGAFLGFMALLSISLAVLNILPVPALDGGHLAFLVYESIFKKEVPAKIKLFAQQVGFALLLLFMAFVIYNDIVHF
ncbi:MAG TPA: RIP metalloprotease RseP [Candidatus Acidoferrales bacterium]|nr:RIP metalloprotease RseP [Candidatus Acidoferrales bacterium]